MQRDAYLAGLAHGSDIDHQGTTFDEPLLERLLHAVRDPVTGQVLLGTAEFGSAVFEGDANFGPATFTGIATFDSATFEGTVRLGSATFERTAMFGAAVFKGIATFGSAVFENVAWFGSAVFGGRATFESAAFEEEAWFGSAVFERTAAFDSASFEGLATFDSAAFKRVAKFGSATFGQRADFGSTIFDKGASFGSVTFERDASFGSTSFGGTAWFGSATIGGGADFDSALFHGPAVFRRASFDGCAGFVAAAFKDDVGFDSALFTQNADFSSAVFAQPVNVGPLVCAGQVTLSGASFDGPVTMAMATRRLVCLRTRWSSTAALRLRHATVDFTHAVFEYPLSIHSESGLFFSLSNGRPLDETLLVSSRSPAVRLASLHGVDAAHLVLADIDLSRCLLTGTVHLDQLRLEGTCSFATVPPRTAWRRGRPVRFTERRTLAEEHHWRARQSGAVPGWNVAVLGAGDTQPDSLAAMYRQLRKAFEDSKNEPGAADFYYGEMEMRRRTSQTPRAERGLLTAYWALSGYGLRATRALVWLLLAMTTTLLAMMLWGLPADDPAPRSTVSASVTGQNIQPASDAPAPEPHPESAPEPVNPSGSLHERMSTERFEKGLRVVVNSVIFRSSGQALTTAGTYTEMASRLFEPALLGLAVLAVRGRIKR
ncbi:pentapeptide repeat-containing protein [Streptomyces longisporoflavus]|uniref:Pentapeptide repeat-containing protein n=1 Tax=Streptomyces longisporoflavus TaxID=28044 RepID=A0ABW7R506_9ACTN